MPRYQANELVKGWWEKYILQIDWIRKGWISERTNCRKIELYKDSW